MRNLNLILATVLILTVSVLAQAWDIDFSRRQKREPASDGASAAIMNSSSTDTYKNNRKKIDGVKVPSDNVDSVAVDSGTGNWNSQPEKKSAGSQPRLREFVSRVVKGKNFDRQELVILNTATGFIPNAVRVRKGVHYTIHVVNVNEAKKNVSFMLDAFEQHHATYFGKIKTFEVDPDKEGVFEFQCPETSGVGRLIVFGGVHGSNPSSENERSVSSTEE